MPAGAAVLRDDITTAIRGAVLEELAAVGYGRLSIEAVARRAGKGTTVLLTTQYLEEAEKLADRIAILHQGTIIVSGTLADLRQLLPPAKAELVERQPSLEEIFLSIVGTKEMQR